MKLVVAIPSDLPAIGGLQSQTWSQDASLASTAPILNIARQAGSYYRVQVHRHPGCWSWRGCCCCYCANPMCTSDRSASKRPKHQVLFLSFMYLPDEALLSVSSPWANRAALKVSRPLARSTSRSRIVSHRLACNPVSWLSLSQLARYELLIGREAPTKRALSGSTSLASWCLTRLARLLDKLSLPA